MLRYELLYACLFVACRKQQGLAVHFTVTRERQRVDGSELGRHHVRRQAVAQVLPDDHRIHERKRTEPLRRVRNEHGGAVQRVRSPAVGPRCHETVLRKRLPVPQQFPDLEQILHQDLFVGFDSRTLELSEFLELVQGEPERPLPRVGIRELGRAELFVPFRQYRIDVAEGVRLGRGCRRRCVEVTQQRRPMPIDELLMAIPQSQVVLSNIGMLR